jgi:hypothetical protein
LKEEGGIREKVKGERKKDDHEFCELNELGLKGFGRELGFDDRNFNLQRL